MLAGADEKVQKQMLGESLYPLIHRLLPDNTHLVGKITGMVLQIDNSELLHKLVNEIRFCGSGGEWQENGKFRKFGEGKW